MVKRSSYMFVTGPDVIKAVTHEEVSSRTWRATTHRLRPPGRHFAAKYERSAWPSSGAHDVPASEQPGRSAGAGDHRSRRPDGRGAADGRPRPAEQAVHIKDIGAASARRPVLLRRCTRGAPNIVVGFGRLGGRPVASWPTSPRHWPAVSTSARRQAARFVRFCDCFNIPLVTFVDVPGFLPGTPQEFEVSSSTGEVALRLLRATVPKLTSSRARPTARLRRHVIEAHPGDANLPIHGRDAVMGPDGRWHPLQAGNGRGKGPGKLRTKRPASTARSSPTRTAAAERGYVD